jgi:hypothetical protein
MSILRNLKPWHIVGLAALVAVVIIGSYGASTLSGRGGAQQPPPTENQEGVPRSSSLLPERSRSAGVWSFLTAWS